MKSIDVFNIKTHSSTIRTFNEIKTMADLEMGYFTKSLDFAREQCVFPPLLPNFRENRGRNKLKRGLTGSQVYLLKSTL